MGFVPSPVCTVIVHCTELVTSTTKQEDYAIVWHWTINIYLDKPFLAHNVETFSCYWVVCNLNILVKKISYYKVNFNHEL